MIQYFRELLAALKKIEEHLAEIRKCVYASSPGHHGTRYAISTQHWNDKR